MSQLIDLGKLRFYFAGEWSVTAIYELNDVVRYGGNVYVYVYAVSTVGTTPTNTTYWALMVSGIKFVGNYDPTVFYPIGDAIAYGGKVYISILDSTGVTPPNATYWSQFADGIEYMGSYSSSQQYKKNDIVAYGPSAYIAIVDTINHDPTNGNYWNRLVSGISASGAWNSSAAYVPGSLVAYGANLYTAVANNTNVPPISATGVLSSANWSLLNTGIRSLGEWTTSSTYYINDVITHGGNSYICAIQHASTVFATDLTNSKWTKFNGGVRARGSWLQSTLYLVNDIITTGAGSAYICAQDHTSSASFNDDVIAGDWTLLAAGGASVLPTVTANSQGKSLTIGSDNSSLNWLNTSGSTYNLFVAPNGSDSNPGTSLALPFASIQKAVSMVPANTKTSIHVKSGLYAEASLPIVLPDTTAIVGDNTRTCIVTPATGLAADGITANNQSTMFKMSNGSIINKITMQGMTGWTPGGTPGDITTSTPKGIFVALNPASPITTKSPYVLECTAISSGGIGAYVDGSVHSSGNRSILFHEFTQIHDGGVGIWVNNNGKSEAVSVFTYYCYFGYATTNGGQIRSLAGNNSYGTYGCWSSGYSSTETPVTGSIYGSMITLTGAYSGIINPGDTITQSSSGATALVTQVQATTIYVTSITGTFTTGSAGSTTAITATSGGAGYVSAIGGQSGFSLVLNNLTALPQVGGSIQISGDSSAYVISGTSGSYTGAGSIIIVTLAQQKANVSTAGTSCTIRYFFSLLRITGHDFLNVGTGGITTTNYPGTPSQAADPSKQVTQNYPGRVYYISTDQSGNFNVGSYFAVNQATGSATLNASAFNLSGLSSLRLGSIGAQLGAQINEFSTDGQMSQNSPVKVPTQSAVVTYVNQIATTIAQNTVAAGVSSIGAPANIIIQTGQSIGTYTLSLFTNKLYTTNAVSTTWSVSGSAAANLTINSSGVLSQTSNLPAGNLWANISATLASGTVITANIPVTSTPNIGTYAYNNLTLPAAIAPTTAFSSNAAVAQFGPNPATPTYTISSGSIPSWANLNPTTGVISGTTPNNIQGYAGVNTFTVTVTDSGYTASKSFSWNPYIGTVQGQSTFTTPGTYSWTAPNAVSLVSAVAIGGGSGGAQSWAGAGGSGGGLGWKNNITVVPQQTYTVVVGTGGTAQNSPSAGGTYSYFISLSTVAGYGGGNGSYGWNGSNASGGPNSNSYGGGYYGDGGGAGGYAPNYQGGAGAGGYNGTGGSNYGSYAPASGTGAASGGGYYSSTYGTGAGGGVGLNGNTGTATNMYNPYQGYNNSYSYGSGGSGGSGGTNGGYGENPFSSTGNYGPVGGSYGGGGGGPGTSWPGGNGGPGGVRIIWGAGRAYSASGSVPDASPSGP